MEIIWDIFSLGPGLITGASDDDPSGIATYSQTGAKFGLGMLWLAIFQYPFMIVCEKSSCETKKISWIILTKGIIPRLSM